MLVKMRKRGFTLVEMLVVMAIIAILAAMIAPVIIEAKQAARMKRCVSNIRQLGMAIQQYLDDNSGYGLPLDRTPQPDPLHSHAYDNSWILYVKPLSRFLGQEVIPPKPDDLAGYEMPNKIWICTGDIWRGPFEDKNARPCWWWWGSSYMYPGVTAYISKAVNDPDGTNIASKDPTCLPLKPMTWRCTRRDLLLADYWFDFHRGYKVPPKDVDHVKVLARDVGVKTDLACINVLFLDLHAAAVTPGQRDDLVDNVRTTDNPAYNPPPSP